MIRGREKIVRHSDLHRIGERARRSGRIVVLANGIFDLLHVGHIRYLQGAKALGDILVVAVNSDASARALKGRGRPIAPLRERLEILSAVSCVDYCVPFGGRRVLSVIQALRPGIHAKGTDYTEASVPERAAVLRAGGRVAIVGDPKNHSTTDIVGRILGRRGR